MWCSLVFAVTSTFRAVKWLSHNSAMQINLKKDWNTSSRCTYVEDEHLYLFLTASAADTKGDWLRQEVVVFHAHARHFVSVMAMNAFVSPCEKYDRERERDWNMKMADYLMNNDNQQYVVANQQENSSAVGGCSPAGICHHLWLFVLKSLRRCFSKIQSIFRELLAVGSFWLMTKTTTFD